MPKELMAAAASAVPCWQTVSPSRAAATTHGTAHRHAIHQQPLYAALQLHAAWLARHGCHNFAIIIGLQHIHNLHQDTVTAGVLIKGVCSTY